MPAAGKGAAGGRSIARDEWLEGFGASSWLHTAKILRLSADLPMVIEIVDTIEKIESFLPVVDGAVGEGLATVEKVDVRFYRGGPSGS